MHGEERITPYKSAALRALQREHPQGLQAVYVQLSEAADDVHIFMDQGANHGHAHSSFIADG